MSMKKNFIYIAISLGLILAFSQIVSAVTVSDATGDVAHWKYTGTLWGWDYNVANKPNIDISELSYSSSEGKVTITMKVAGSIESSEFIVYWAMMNTSDSTYLVTYNDGEGGGYAMNIGGGGSGQMDFEPVTTASGNTLSCTYNISSESFSGVEFWGYAAEYTTYGDITNEWWGDWAPNSNSPFYDDQPDSPDDDDDDDDENGNGGSTNTTGTGTPGFEIIILLTAIFAFVLFARKRKM